MICSETSIRTAHASGYLAELAGRLSEPAAVGDGGHKAHFDIRGGHCDLQADTERLVIACSGEQEEVVSELRRLVEQNFPDQQPGDEIAINWRTIPL